MRNPPSLLKAPQVPILTGRPWAPPEVPFMPVLCPTAETSMAVPRVAMRAYGG